MQPKAFQGTISARKGLRTNFSCEAATPNSGRLFVQYAGAGVGIYPCEALARQKPNATHLGVIYIVPT